MALEPAIKSELVVEQQVAMEALEGDLDPERPEDPYRVREVKNVLRTVLNWFLHKIYINFKYKNIYKYKGHKVKNNKK